MSDHPVLCKRNGDINFMNMTKYIALFLLVFFLAGCSQVVDEETKEVEEANQQPVMFPNYLIINAPSKDPEMQWYVSDYFRKTGRWELETTEYSELEMGMYELTQYPDQEATQAQKDAANKLIEDSFDTVLRNGWLVKEKGLSDGFEKMYGDPVHFVNVEYVFDGETLNPEKPEVLMYYRTEEGDFLMGVMYLAIGERGPQVAGPLSRWHYHIDRRMCYERGVLPIGAVNQAGECEAGFANVRSPEMLHVWFFDHPDGRFATTMGLSGALLKTGIKQVRELEEARQ